MSTPNDKSIKLVVISLFAKLFEFDTHTVTVTPDTVTNNGSTIYTDHNTLKSYIDTNIGVPSKCCNKCYEIFIKEEQFMKDQHKNTVILKQALLKYAVQDILNEVTDIINKSHKLMITTNKLNKIIHDLEMETE